MNVSRATHALLIFMAGLVTVGGCGTDRTSTIVVTHYRNSTAMTTGPRIDPYGRPLPQLRWGNDDRLILTTWGSSSCPLLPSAVILHTAHRFTISVESAGGPCTQDLSPTDSVIDVPPGLDIHMPTLADIQGDAVALPPRN